MYPKERKKERGEVYHFIVVPSEGNKYLIQFPIHLLSTLSPKEDDLVAPEPHWSLAVFMAVTSLGRYWRVSLSLWDHKGTNSTKTTVWGKAAYHRDPSQSGVTLPTSLLPFQSLGVFRAPQATGFRASGSLVPTLSEPIAELACRNFLEASGENQFLATAPRDRMGNLKSLPHPCSPKQISFQVMVVWVTAQE